jgi:hypothetical protein
MSTRLFVSTLSFLALGVPASSDLPVISYTVKYHDDRFSPQVDAFCCLLDTAMDICAQRTGSFRVAVPEDPTDASTHELVLLIDTMVTYDLRYQARRFGVRDSALARHQERLREFYAKHKPLTTAQKAVGSAVATTALNIIGAPLGIVGFVLIGDAEPPRMPPGDRAAVRRAEIRPKIRGRVTVTERATGRVTLRTRFRFRDRHSDMITEAEQAAWLLRSIMGFLREIEFEYIECPKEDM